MAKITEKQLIESLKQLKEIKPRKEWALLLKSQILAEKQAEIKIAEQPEKTIGILDIFSFVFSQKKMAYSLATLVFVIVGLIGFAQYTMPGDLLFPIRKISEQSQAALAGKTTLKQEIANLNNRISDLALVAKEGKKDNIPSAIVEINANASELVKNLKVSLVKDKEAIKEISVSLKTLADVPGTDLSENSDVKDLYQTVVKSQIDDLEKTTLTDEQKETLLEIKDLYIKGKYVNALEKILLIDK